MPLISRYLDTPLDLADSATAKLSIGGIYNTRELAGIVDLLPQVLPAQVSRTDDGHLLVKSRQVRLQTRGMFPLRSNGNTSHPPL